MLGAVAAFAYRHSLHLLRLLHPLCLSTLSPFHPSCTKSLSRTLLEHSGIIFVYLCPSFWHTLCIHHSPFFPQRRPLSQSQLHLPHQSPPLSRTLGLLRLLHIDFNPGGSERTLSNIVAPRHFLAHLACTHCRSSPKPNTFASLRLVLPGPHQPSDPQWHHLLGPANPNLA